MVFRNFDKGTFPQRGRWQCRAGVGRWRRGQGQFTGGFARARRSFQEHRRDGESSRWSPRADRCAHKRGDRTQNLDRLFQALKAAPRHEGVDVQNRIVLFGCALLGYTAKPLMTRARPPPMRRITISRSSFSTPSSISNRTSLRPGSLHRIFRQERLRARAFRHPRCRPAPFRRRDWASSWKNWPTTGTRSTPFAARWLFIPYLERIPDLVRSSRYKADGRDIRIPGSGVRNEEAGHCRPDS